MGVATTFAVSEQTAEARRLKAANRGHRIGILVVTYNAVTTLSKVLKRIPPPVWENVEEVLVFDDASQDATYELAVGLKAVTGENKLQVLRHHRNLGYGGNQKAGYRYFLSKGYDIVVLLHGDGQYAPEVLADMYAPLVSGEADAVFGSRMMKEYGGPLKGGMPLYKYIGNRILTHFENRALGLNLTEWHSGFRAYSLHALKHIDLTRMTDDFHFDTEIIVKLHHQGFRIREVPIPTFYGDEICYVNGLRYARDILRSVYRYHQTKNSIACHPEYREYFVKYKVKTSTWSGHQLARDAVGTGQRVLELTTGSAAFGDELRKAGNRVVTAGPSDEVSVQTDLSRSLLPLKRELGRERFTRVLLLDVLEHLVSPERVLRNAADLLDTNGRIVISLPNVANLTVRLQLLAGSFRYAERGILDRTHLHFYTRQTARELIQSAGYDIVESKMTVMPLEVTLGAPRWLERVLHSLLVGLTRLMPGLLGYESFFVARKKSQVI